MTRWHARGGCWSGGCPPQTASHAVLARTNAELAPFAAVALEKGIPYRAAEDGLLVDDPARGPATCWPGDVPRDVPLAVALARSGTRSKVVSALARVVDRRSDVSTISQIESRAAVQDVPSCDATTLSLILATAHGTKGLEFDHVACIGLDDGIFPSRRTIEDHEDPARAVEEERRLAYVAWTRAKKSLTLVYDPAAPSMFMSEAFSPDELGLLAKAA